jgi:hypothetical protein
MTLSVGGVEYDATSRQRRPTKRRKTGTVADIAPDTSAEYDVVRRHPLGVRPAGNALTAPVNAKDSSGSFARLPDEVIVLLLEILQIPHLLKLGATCRALHAFTRNEELWRSLFIE